MDKSTQTSDTKPLEQYKLVRLTNAEMWVLAKCVYSMIDDTEQMKDIRASFAKIIVEDYCVNTADIPIYFNLFAALIEVPADAIQNFNNDVLSVVHGESTEVLQMCFDNILSFRADISTKDKIHINVDGTMVLIAF